MVFLVLKFRFFFASNTGASVFIKNTAIKRKDLRFRCAGSCNSMTFSSHYPHAKVNLSHVARSSPPPRKSLSPFCPFLEVFFCLSLSDSPITLTVPVFSHWCLGVKFIPFTIDFRRAAFALSGHRDTQKLFAGGKKRLCTTKQTVFKLFL